MHLDHHHYHRTFLLCATRQVQQNLYSTSEKPRTLSRDFSSIMKCEENIIEQLSILNLNAQKQGKKKTK